MGREGGGSTSPEGLHEVTDTQHSGKGVPSRSAHSNLERRRLAVTNCHGVMIFFSVSKLGLFLEVS